MAKKQSFEQVTRYADMLSAMGTEPRLRIMRLLLSAHPDGMIVGDIGMETRNSQLNSFSPSRKAEKRGSGYGASRTDVPLVRSQHRSTRRSARLSVCRMLLA